MTETIKTLLQPIQEQVSDYTASNEEEFQVAQSLTCLLGATQAVTALHVPVMQNQRGPHREMCRHDTYDWPCPTVSAVVAALSEAR